MSKGVADSFLISFLEVVLAELPEVAVEVFQTVFGEAVVGAEVKQDGFEGEVVLEVGVVEFGEAVSFAEIAQYGVDIAVVDGVVVGSVVRAVF